MGIEYPYNNIIVDILLIFLPIVNLFLAIIAIGSYLLELDFSNINRKLLKIFYFRI